MQFRTKARAVDLLGKGQIADLPTAITELWKNGYDAYADNLKAEIYIEGYKELEVPYFLISDDGKGMSQKDILEKWLVLGTDSKSRAKLEEMESAETLWKSPRIKAGEKGIGRLSVAYLGNPMLMLTKKIGYPLQIMFFDWRILENFNLFLNDIIIPVKELKQGELFQHAFKALKKEFLSNFDKKFNSDGQEVWEPQQLTLKEEIVHSVKISNIENFIEQDILKGLTASDEHGTKFLIFEPIQQITQLAAKDEDDIEDRKFVISSLSGFTNPFKKIEIKVETFFPIHKEKGNDYDLLTSQGKFFTKDDYLLADVLIDGEFDGNGSFTGKIRIYDKTIDYSFSNPRQKDARNKYGSIPIKLGYSQGEERSSQLDDVSFKKLKEKVSNYGGLYIYRDNFRVLPYGRENFDFLNFEGRRSRGAGYYYFSYRRMFGYLDISRERNPKLKDKSSREGLISNAQYRAFYSDITNFFIELAKDYFATDPRENLFIDKKKELNEKYESIKADKKREKQAKIDFTKSLNIYPEKLKSYQKEYEDLLSDLELKLSQINITYYEVEGTLDNIHQLDAEYNKLLPKIPKRYDPTDTQLDRLDKYSLQLQTFNEKISQIKTPLFEKAQKKLDIRDLKIDFSKRLSKYNGQLESTINENRSIFKETIDNLFVEYNQRANRILEELNKDREVILNDIDSKEKISGYSDLIETRYNGLVNEINKTLIPLVNHIKILSFDLDEELIQGAYKAEYENIKHQWMQTREAAQLGIAVEIIDHEFNQLYAKINNSLSILSNEKNINSLKEFKYLFQNFKQLEDKYELLSPLYRISGASIKDVSGKDIVSYMNTFFENSMKDYKIDFKATTDFLKHKLQIKEPVIHTVFINLINNAIYWMRNSKVRKLKLDYLERSNEIVISNSGERIEEHRLDKIFQLFYSNRPNGRGIGLYLSKQSLNEAGYDIYATNDKKLNDLNGACFVVNKLMNP